jgi:hypothetical protein
MHKTKLIAYRRYLLHCTAVQEENRPDVLDSVFSTLNEHVASGPYPSEKIFYLVFDSCAQVIAGAKALNLLKLMKAVCYLVDVSCFPVEYRNFA